MEICHDTDIFTTSHTLSLKIQTFALKVLWWSLKNNFLTSLLNFYGNIYYCIERIFVAHEYESLVKMAHIFL